jgi:hypothetical protein
MKTAHTFKFAITALLLSAVLFAGCPYKFNVALPKNEHISRKLLGKWETVDKTYKYTIQKIDGKTYRVYSENLSNHEIEKFEGHLSEIEKSIFINLKDPKTNQYLIAKLEREKDILTLFYVNDDFVKSKKGSSNFTREEELTGFIAAHQDNQNLYEKAMVLNKIKEK